MNIRNLVFLGVLSLTACTPTLDHTQIKEVARNIYVEDGVDKIEAILLAQNFIIRESYYDRLQNLKPTRVAERVAFFKNNEPIIYVIVPIDQSNVIRQRTWTVYFKDKRHSLPLLGINVVPFKVVIDADSGAILNWGLDKLGDPDIYSYEKIYEQDMI